MHKKSSNFQEIKENKGWGFKWKNEKWKSREMNDRLMMAERALTDREGLSGRPWYKHLVYFLYPPAWNNNVSLLEQIYALVDSH